MEFWVSTTLAERIEAAQQRIAELEEEVERLADADGALRELHAQAERWKIPMPVRGDPRAPAVWVLKLVEEVGEVASALLGEAIGKEGRGDVRQELNQVIASALAARAALAPEEQGG